MHAGFLTSFAVQGISEAHDVTVVEPLVTIRSTMKDSDRKTMEALATAIAEA